MAVKIRLQRKGRKKRPFYHIVVADSRAPRDGRFIERLGSYNPMTKPATIELDRDKAFSWIEKGAQPTDTARAILRFKGVYYRKHLMRGVKKGAMTLEEAETLYNKWIEEKEAKIAARFEQTSKEKQEFYAQVSGVAPVIETPAEEEPAAEEAEAPVEAEAPAEEATEEVATETPEAEAETADETPAQSAEEEAPAEKPKAEAETSAEEVKAEEE